MVNETLDKRKVAFHTLGCKVNQQETVAMETLFLNKNWEVVDFKEVADVYIINTCTVTHIADRKSRQILRRAVSHNPNALVVACGCYSQVNAKEVEKIEGVDLICGTVERTNIVEIVENYLEKADKTKEILLTDVRKERKFTAFSCDAVDVHHARGIVKIQEGCNQFCTYCIVPYSRGRERSLPPNDVVKEVAIQVNAGHNEVVLAGIHVGNYGKDLEPATSLTELLKMLINDFPHTYFRLGSVEPQEITDELLHLMAEHKNISKQLHIPLQSPSDVILKKMGRHYTMAEYMALVEKARALMPEVGITTDIMVGFPSETDEDFQEMIENMKKIKFSKSHIFPYSKREGTKAALINPQVDDKVKNQRVKELTRVAKIYEDEFSRSYIGRKLEILLEQEQNHNGENYFSGHSSNFQEVLVKIGSTPLKRNEIVNVLIKSYEDGKLFGEIC